MTEIEELRERLSRIALERLRTKELLEDAEMELRQSEGHWKEYFERKIPEYRAKLELLNKEYAELMKKQKTKSREQRAP